MNMNRILLSPNSDKSKDTTLELFRSLNSIHSNDNLKSEIEFEKGEYHFYSDFCREEFFYVSNNFDSLKRSPALMSDFDHLTIEGNGSEFIYHGEITPFIIDNCRHIELKNFSIDWKRPFYSQGTVCETHEDSIVIEISPDYPYRVKGDKLLFLGEGYEEELVDGIFEMDPRTKAPAYLSGDGCGSGFIKTEFIKFDSISEGIVRIHYPFNKRPTVGNELILRHYKRNCPGIFIKNSSNVLLNNVHVHHAGAMGVIAQFTENIKLDNCSVSPKKGSNRLFSTTVDATHFVSCKGVVELKNCLFENQLDDPANIHGIYTRIKEKLDPKTLILELVHSEQKGVEIGFSGDSVQFVNPKTFQSVSKNEMESLHFLNKDFAVVSFKNEIADSVDIGFVMENTTWIPNLIIHGCTARNNRARGFLITTRGKVLIENNHVSASGAAIKISGDTNNWFESGPVREILIQNNYFHDCNYGPWGKAVIIIDPEIEKKYRSEHYFHKNITIRDNVFDTFENAILYGFSIDGFCFEGNEIKKNENYKAVHNDRPVIELSHSKNIRIEDNIFHESTLNNIFKTEELKNADLQSVSSDLMLPQ
jgi:hypothetical protein